MSRPWPVLALLVVLAPGPARADDEPKLRGKTLAQWITQLHKDKDLKERQRAVIAVEFLSDKQARLAAGALGKALREDEGEGVRESAALALGRVVAKAFAQARADKKDDLPSFDGARDALLTQLGADKADKVREACATALGDVGPDFKEAVGALTKAVKDKHAGTKAAAVNALRRMGKDAKDALPELREVLIDKKAPALLRTHAAGAIGMIGADAAAAVTNLKDVLADAKAGADLRRACAEALGRMGRDAREASAVLGDALTAKDSPVALRLACAATLDGLGADARAALPNLIKAARDSDRYVRCLALHALGRMGKDLDTQRKAAVEELLRGAKDGPVEVRVAAMEALTALGPDGLGAELDGVVKELEKMVEREGRKDILEAAKGALGKLAKKPKG